MKKKLAFLLAATMVVTMVTAGCGSKSDDQKTAKKQKQQKTLLQRARGIHLPLDLMPISLRMDTKQMMVLM